MVDPSQSPALNRGARDWHADMFRECKSRNREIVVSTSMELVNPPAGFGAVYYDGKVVETKPLKIVGDPDFVMTDANRKRYYDMTLDLHEMQKRGDQVSSALSSLARGQAIAARSDAWPGVAFDGEVADIDSRIDPDTRAVTVRAVLPNPDGRLRAGMLLRVSVRLPVRQALVLPEIAVQQEGSQASVFRVGGGDKVALVPVELGSRREGKVEVTSGLKAGDRIVVDGIVKLHDGSRIVEAAARAAGGAAPAAAR